MKTVLLACLVAAVAAAPQLDIELPVVANAEFVVDLPVAAAPRLLVKPIVELLRDDRVDNGDGNFNFAIEADNGVNMQVAGTPGAEGGVNMEGSYSFLLADGTVAVVKFIANENGFQPQSDLLPTPHPLPAHVYELLRIAERQRAEGITFE